jgi:hypothetical protein
MGSGLGSLVSSLKQVVCDPALAKRCRWLAESCYVVEGLVAGCHGGMEQKGRLAANRQTTRRIAEHSVTYGENKHGSSHVLCCAGVSGGDVRL